MKSLGLCSYVKKYKGPLADGGKHGVAGGHPVAGSWLVKDRDRHRHRPGRGSEAVAVLARLALVALAVYVARAGLQFVRSYMAHVAGWHVVADVRAEILSTCGAYRSASTRTNRPAS
jgi:ATP-binding cassette subfamily B protein/subfamily B ATP-binding cassette protein MsbA